MQKFLGHATIKETADTYTHVLDDLKQNEILKLDSAVNYWAKISGRGKVGVKQQKELPPASGNSQSLQHFTDRKLYQTLNQNFKESELKKVRVFYCPGGFNYEKMSAPSRLMMKLFLKSLRAKKDKTEAEQEMIRMISSSYDIADRKYIEPILECLKK